MLYEALRRVLPNPTEAPVSLLISMCLITMTIRSIMSLGMRKTEINSTMFRNISYWSKIIHKAIPEVLRRNHFVDIKFSSWCIVVWSIGSFLGSRVKDEILRKLLEAGSRCCVYEDVIPETTEFASCVHSSILKSFERMSRHRRNFFRAKNGGFIMLHNTRCK